MTIIFSNEYREYNTENTMNIEPMLEPINNKVLIKRIVEDNRRFRS